MIAALKKILDHCLHPSAPARTRLPAPRRNVYRPGRFETLEDRRVLAGIYPPMAVDDYYETKHDHALTAPESVLANDMDYDGDSLSVSLVSGPSNAAAFSLSSDGSFTYEPTANWKGTDSFTYSVSDGTESAQATATIEVTNIAPMAVDDTYSTAHNSVVMESSPGVLANDMDYDGDALIVTFLSGPAHAEDFELYTNGSFFYDPVDTFTGNDTFTYLVSDGIDTATATVTITVTNSAPYVSGMDDVLVNVNSNDTVISLGSYFSDMEDMTADLTFSVAGNTNGALFDSVTVSGSQLTLDYAADAPGTSQITVRATDTGGLYAEASFDVIVNAPPQITSFNGSMYAGMWTFFGHVDDESPGGLMISFGGLLMGHYTTTDSSGNFSYTAQVSGPGTITSQTWDAQGMASNIANKSIS